MVLNTEEISQMYFVKNMLQKVLESSQEKTCIRVSKIPGNFEEFARTPFFIENLRWLFLSIRL